MPLPPAARRALGNPWLTSAVAHALLTVLLVAGGESYFLQASLFTDVLPTSPHEKAISWLEDQGYVHGHPDGTFGPDEPINRAEFVQMLINVTGFKSRATPCLADFREQYGKKARFLRDVAPGVWYEGAVCVALQQGVLIGEQDRTFRADNYVSFAEAATMLVRAYGIPRKPQTEHESWYEPAVHALAEKNAIPLDVVSFTASISRALVAEMFYRVSVPVANLPSLTFDQVATQSRLHAAAPSLDDPNDEMVALINATRWQYGLPAVKANVPLENAASGHAKDMAVREYYDHDGPGGVTPPDRIKAAGYETATLENCNCQSVLYRYGEVITRARTVDEAFDSFMNSRDHRDILLSPDFKDVGIGNYKGYWVGDFGLKSIGY